MLLVWGAALSTAASPSASEVAERDSGELLPLVKQLDADTLQARQQASDQLLAKGSQAIGPIAQTLPHASAEQTMRGLAILKKLMQSSDEDTKRQARAAVEQLSHAQQQALASQAAAILQAEDPLARTPTRSSGQVVGIPGGIRMFQLQMMNGPATRRVVASENGRTVVIAESVENGITVTVSERVGDKDQTTTVAAKSTTELDQKSPQAGALYRKYSALGGFGFPNRNALLAPGIVFPPQTFRGSNRSRPAPAVNP
jgi:hypothetical protein